MIISKLLALWKNQCQYGCSSPNNKSLIFIFISAGGNHLSAWGQGMNDDQVSNGKMPHPPRTWYMQAITRRGDDLLIFILILFNLHLQRIMTFWTLILLTYINKSRKYHRNLKTCNEELLCKHKISFTLLKPELGCAHINIHTSGRTKKIHF